MSNAFQTVISELTGMDSAERTDEANLHRLLADSIANLLQQPHEKLFQILYRLDVSEKKVHQVLENFTASEWPSEIARLILHREKERQFWRTRYKQNPKSDLAS